MKTVIIGAGAIAHPHARALKELHIEIAGVFDVNQETAKALADRYSTKAISCIDQVMDQVDMVHICTPPAFRLEYVQKAVQAGKHIFIEKPIATNVEDGLKMAAMASKYNVKVMVGYNHRFRKGYQLLHDAVRCGQLGDLISIFSTRVGLAGNTSVNVNWRTDSKAVCGMTIESLSHDIDMILHLTNGIESVKAYTYGTIKEMPAYDNNAVVSLRLKNGGIGSINASWCSHIGYSSRGVIGSKGAAMLFGDKLFDFSNFALKTDTMPYEMITKVNDNYDTSSGNDQFASPSYRVINQHFIESIINDTKPLASIGDGINTLLVSKAILESMDTGQEIFINQQSEME